MVETRLILNGFVGSRLLNWFVGSRRLMGSQRRHAAPFFPSSPSSLSYLQYLHFRIALEALNIAFLSIYTLEMALKVVLLVCC